MRDQAQGASRLPGGVALPAHSSGSATSGEPLEDEGARLGDELLRLGGGNARVGDEHRLQPVGKPRRSDLEPFEEGADALQLEGRVVDPVERCDDADEVVRRLHEHVETPDRRVASRRASFSS